MKQIIILAALALTLACQKTPPNLTPGASLAFKATQGVRALDLLRDVAIEANAQVPPLLSDATTRKVVLYHQSTVRVIQASPGGWKVIAQTGLIEVSRNLSPRERGVPAPYVSLLTAVIGEVP